MKAAMDIFYDTYVLKDDRVQILNNKRNKFRLITTFPWLIWLYKKLDKTNSLPKLLEALKNMKVNFLVCINKILGTDMKTAHIHMKLKGSEFDIIVSHLV